MMYKKILPAVLVISTIMMSSPSSAQYMGLDEETFVREGMKGIASDSMLQELVENSTTFLDVNFDNFISENEFSYFLTGLDASQTGEEQQKERQKQQASEFFRQADKNQDNRLEQEELKTFFTLWQEYLLHESFAQKDLNGDKILDEKDIPPIEDSIRKMNESVEKLKSATEQLNKIDPQKAAQDMMQNMEKMQAQEDFYQMDKDGNGCVSKEDYTAYKVEENKNLAKRDESLVVDLTKEDYAEIYDLIEKKDPNCLTREEYIADYTAPLDLEDSANLEDSENFLKK